MPRELTGHKVNGVNDGLDVLVLDDPGSGGANHKYVIQQPPPPVGRRQDGITFVERVVVPIEFQNGPIKEVGINGITHETLTAILIDRFEGFQRGPYACDDNEEALGYFRKAQEAMLRRTKARAARGVEGTHAV